MTFSIVHHHLLIFFLLLPHCSVLIPLFFFPLPSPLHPPSPSSRDNDITGVLDHTFCVEHHAYGEIIQHELKPNGKSIPVSEETKKEYVR